MPLPTFLLLGAPRAGTTSVYSNLANHPQVFMSAVKEPHFLAVGEDKSPFRGPSDIQGVRSFEKYSSLFDGVTNETAIGEASTSTLASDRAPALIKAHMPNAKLVAILRNPVDRAWSNYMQHVQQGRETELTLSGAIRLESERKAKGWSPFWCYSHSSMYGEQVARYLEHFPAEQCLWILFEDLENSPAKTYSKIFSHIGVDPDAYVDQHLKLNKSGTPRNALVASLLKHGYRFRAALEPVIPHAIRRTARERLENATVDTRVLSDVERAELVELFRADILRLERLIGRDLRHWL